MREEGVLGNPQDGLTGDLRHCGVVGEVWIAPRGHPGVAVVVGVVVVHRVLGTSFNTEVNLGHFSEVFSHRKEWWKGRGSRRRFRTYG